MKQILLIGLGGFLGSISRYGVHLLSQKWIDHLPSSTLAVNLVGSLLIGVLIGLSIRSDQPIFWFIGVGFCGAFTTFSTFALEGVNFIKNDRWIVFIGYFSISVTAGLLACFLGIWIGSKFV